MKKYLLASIIAGLLCVAATPVGASQPVLTNLTKHENVLARCAGGYCYRHAYYYSYPDYYYTTPGYYYYDPYYYSPYGSTYFWW